MTGDFYVCPHHSTTGGYESCCACGGWEEGDEDYGRECTEATEDDNTPQEKEEVG